MKMMRHLAVTLLSVACLAADTAEAPETTLRTAAVAAFKNGLGFVIKQGAVTLDKGTVTIGPIPNATLGSLWIAPNDASVSLDEVVARRYKLSTLQNTTTMTDVLLANPGRIVTIVDHNQKEYTGEIAGFQSTNKLESKILPPQPEPAPEILLLKSDGKLVALYFCNIARVVLPADAVVQQKREEEHTALQVRVKGADSHANLTMGYLESGLGWTPSYLLSLQDDNKAQLTMQAVLVNDAEEMQNTDVFFVVGVPNFAYSHVLSPMALQQQLFDFIRDASAVNAASRPYSNAIMGQARGEFMKAAAADSAGFESLFEELQGSPEEDLFLYGRKGVTLAKGQRATYNVFSDTVSYEHVYQWDIRDQPRVDGFGNVQNQNPNDSSENSIWHSLRLKNATRFPWTSAPAMVISGTKPLSQETLAYTPKGATTNLKLTIATDIRATQNEKEVARQQEIQRRRNYSYDQVTVGGTLTIKNYKSKEVRLAISRTVRGEIDSQTDGGTSDKLGEAIAVDNPLSRLNWEITLKPGEERVVTYRYKVWLRV